jgi:hypothetical protein
MSDRVAGTRPQLIFPLECYLQLARTLHSEAEMIFMTRSRYWGWPLMSVAATRMHAVSWSGRHHLLLRSINVLSYASPQDKIKWVQIKRKKPDDRLPHGRFVCLENGCSGTHLTWKVRRGVVLKPRAPTNIKGCVLNRDMLVQAPRRFAITCGFVGSQRFRPIFDGGFSSTHSCGWRLLVHSWMLAQLTIHGISRFL